jgi:GH25 family lysozyme M1 (1,4-beta-N-acetylmuramidase)
MQIAAEALDALGSPYQRKGDGAMPTLVRGIDVSSHQSSDLGSLISTHGPNHIVVRLYLPEENPSQDHTRAQIASARAAGCTVGGYVWCYQDMDPRKTVRDAIALARSVHLMLPVLWLDCETYKNSSGVTERGPDAPWIRAAADECRQLGVRPGIYTARWWWRDFMDDTTEFADLPLWAAEYDDNPDVDDVTLFGGWTRASGKQYAEKLPSGAGLDQNVFRDEVTADGATPPPPSPTLAELEATRPNFGRNVLEWQRARYGNSQNPNDYPACRTHLRAIGTPDPGEVEFVGFRRSTIEEVEAGNPNIRRQLAEWQQARRQNGEDPNDYEACRRHLLAIAADPGQLEFLGFFS